MFVSVLTPFIPKVSRVKEFRPVTISPRSLSICNGSQRTDASLLISLIFLVTDGLVAVVPEHSIIGDNNVSEHSLLSETRYDVLSTCDRYFPSPFVHLNEADARITQRKMIVSNVRHKFELRHTFTNAQLESTEQTHFYRVKMVFKTCDTAHGKVTHSHDDHIHPEISCFSDKTCYKYNLSQVVIIDERDSSHQCASNGEIFVQLSFQNQCMNRLGIYRLHSLTPGESTK